MTPRLEARLVDAVVDRGVFPDTVLRRVARLLLRRRLASTTAGTVEERDARKRTLVAALADAPVAIDVARANDQHYEVPTELFELMLGPHLKYSSGYWPVGVSGLAEAEEAMLRLTCERAELLDGQDVLELGCGWGSLTLWMAERFPASRITGVSNSETQREHIEKQAARRGLDNVRVLTCDVNRLGAGAGAQAAPGAFPDIVHDGAFDRVVSVEMFEHVRNHATLTSRIAGWLRPGGKLFVHHFSHATDPYPFDTGERADWMARHFFTGGLMPSHDLLLMSVRDLVLEDRWALSGRHYARSLRAWRDRLDANRGRVLRILQDQPDGVTPGAALNRWRLFTIACEELFAFAGGDVWHVTHLRFVRPQGSEDTASPAPGRT